MMNNEYQKIEEELLKTAVQHEKGVIGAILQDENSAVLAVKILNESYFTISLHTHIFKIVKECVDRGEAANKIYYAVTALSDEEWGVLAHKSVDKTKYLNECFALAITTLGNQYLFEGCLNSLKEQYFKRKIIEESKILINNIYINSTAKNINTLINDTINTFENTTELLINDYAPQDFKSLALEIISKKQSNLINSGYPSLDKIIEGFKSSQLVVIGAATSVGKSAFAINVALNICDQNEKVALWSFEMDEQEIMHRIFAIRTGYNSYPLKNGTVSEEHYNALRKYIDNTKDDIKIFTKHITSLEEFYLHCRRLKITENVKVIIIDYLQLIHLSGNYENNRVRELEKITNTFKKIASELDILIITLSQLSREVHKRKEQTPILSDLRDSGSIEQDANIVILLNRAKSYDPTEKLIEFIVAKNRSGKTGSCTLKYQSNLTKFSEQSNLNI